MTNAKTEYMSENEDYLEDPAIVNMIPESMWDKMIELVIDPMDTDATTTTETIQDFKNSRENKWAKRGQIADEGDSYCLFENVQTKLGERRKDVLVINADSTRVCLTIAN